MAADWAQNRADLRALSERISVTVRETPFGEVTHTIRDPDAITVEEPAETDEDPRVAVHVTGPGEHLVVRVDRPAAHT